MGFKRRNFFINKELQGRYIFQYFLLVIFGSVLFSLVFSFLTSNSLSIVYDNYHLELGTTPGILLRRILSTQWIFIVVIGLITIVITLFLTHRIAGPFYRFEKTLDSMGKKDFTQKIVLRKKDEGKDLAQKMNDFNVMASKELNQLRSRTQAIDLICKGITQETKNNLETPQTTRTEILEIKKINQKNLEFLHEFNLLKD